jgi:NADPH:quinone reductase-like Zn-dependent oxidoreductase
VLLTGASGGVGHYLVELAARQGALVTAVTGSPQRGQRLRQLGAADIVHNVSSAAGPFDVVMESTGGDALMAALRAARAGGQVIWFGQASGVPPVLDFFDWDVPLGVTLHRFGYQPPGHPTPQTWPPWSASPNAATCTPRSGSATTGRAPPPPSRH